MDNYPAIYTLELLNRSPMNLQKTIKNIRILFKTFVLKSFKDLNLTDGDKNENLYIHIIKKAKKYQK